MSLRLPRLIVIFTVLLVSATLYLLYPSNRTPRSPGDLYDRYEAGGIDQVHYREAIVPNFEKEEARARLAAAAGGAECDDDYCAPIVPGQEVVKAPSIAPPLSGKERLAKGIQQVGGGLAGWFGGGAGAAKDSSSSTKNKDAGVHDLLHGDVIMPKLQNATAKAELGRAAWRVLHLMTLRYPEVPTESERESFKSYFHLFARMYPCGECAEEFQKLLKEYPPQTGSRKSASLWLCHVHNQVNLRLGKPEFDCLTLDETYDCGCGDEESAGSPPAKAAEDEDKRYPPPQKGQIGGKILGGKKGGKDAAELGWKPAAPPAAAAAPAPAPAPAEDAPGLAEDVGTGRGAGEGDDDPGHRKDGAMGISVVQEPVDEEARQVEMIELAQEELSESDE